jgi:hypothetical protein
MKTKKLLKLYHVSCVWKALTLLYSHKAESRFARALYFTGRSINIVVIIIITIIIIISVIVIIIIIIILIILIIIIKFDLLLSKS